jgi:hypothetical protein
VIGKEILTAVEDADFLEDVHAVARARSSRRSQCKIIASSDRFALQDDGEY